MTENQPTVPAPITPAAVMHVMAGTMRVPPRPETAYNRHRWEQALIATPVPHHNALLLGWALAHVAGDAGYVAPGAGDAASLAGPARLTPKQVRLFLRQLEKAGLISRPDIHTWQSREVVRPLWLILPTGAERNLSAQA
jgi:hypothetical protein